jgi:hypothetical protein
MILVLKIIFHPGIGIVLLTALKRADANLSILCRY